MDSTYTSHAVRTQLINSRSTAQSCMCREIQEGPKALHTLAAVAHTNPPDMRPPTAAGGWRRRLDGSQPPRPATAVSSTTRWRHTPDKEFFREAQPVGPATVQTADWPGGPTRQWPTGDHVCGPACPVRPIRSGRHQMSRSSHHWKSWLPEPDLGPGGRSLSSVAGAGHVGPFTRLPPGSSSVTALGRGARVQGSRHHRHRLHQARAEGSQVSSSPANRATERGADLRPTRHVPTAPSCSCEQGNWQRPIASSPLCTCAHQTLEHDDAMATRPLHRAAAASGRHRPRRHSGARPGARAEAPEHQRAAAA
jgi:hypothetical protein